MSYEPERRQYGRTLQKKITENTTEIATILQKLRVIYEKKPAVLSLINVLQNVPVDPYYDLIKHIIDYFDQLHNLLMVARKKLTKVLGAIGFEFLPHRTRINSYITLFNPDESYNSNRERIDYADVRCNFVFANKKTYETFELMTQFRVGITSISEEGFGCDIEWWATSQLELDFNDINRYNLNKMITCPKEFSREIQGAVSEICHLFAITNRLI